MITQNALLGYKDVTSLNVTQGIDRKDSKNHRIISVDSGTDVMKLNTVLQ